MAVAITSSSEIIAADARAGCARRRQLQCADGVPVALTVTAR
jgi:hypothetical protein